MNDLRGVKSDILLKLSYGLLLPSLFIFCGSAMAGSAEYEGDVARELPLSEGTTLVLLPSAELTELVSRVALYPDDLLGIVLPASTYPLQIVQAARYLKARKADASLEPDKAWDDSIVALLNYPEILNVLNGDLNWTWKLGEAVLNQHEDVIVAVTRFREIARANAVHWARMVF